MSFKNLLPLVLLQLNKFIKFNFLKMAVFNNQVTNFLIIQHLAFMSLLWLQHVIGQYHHCHFKNEETAAQKD